MFQKVVLHCNFILIGFYLTLNNERTISGVNHLNVYVTVVTDSAVYITMVTASAVYVTMVTDSAVYVTMVTDSNVYVTMVTYSAVYVTMVTDSAEVHFMPCCIVIYYHMFVYSSNIL